MLTCPFPASGLQTAAGTGCKGQSEAVPTLRKQVILQSVFFKEKNTNPIYFTKGTSGVGGKKEDKGDGWREAVLLLSPGRETGAKVS